MNLAVNDVTIPADAIACEAALLADAPDPDAAARRTLAIRELLLQRAGELGLLEGGAARGAVTFADREAEDETVARVLEAEVKTPAPSTDECRRYYDTHAGKFTSGDLVEARHILFAVTPGAPVMALRDRAERELATLKADPAPFADRARELSNCPSGQHGGNLGQFGRGEMVPEFDRALFGNAISGVLPTLVATRYGFHIVSVERRITGRVLPFDEVAASVAQFLAARVEERALKQYVEVLAGRAQLTGVDLEAAATPLVQ
ncbi:MAG: peptidylprolyl isomerase [Betaproteobacteria bacterium]